MSTAYRRAAPGDDSAPAPNVETLLEALESQPGHALSVEEWAALLSDLRPDDYAGRPQAGFPGPPGLTRDDRIGLMAARVESGRSPFHESDPWEGHEDGLGGVVLRNGRNGTTYEGEVVDAG